MTTSQPTDGDPETEGQMAGRQLVYQPLDKTSFIPLPAQILAQLEGMIRAGKLAEGDPVPGEEDLSQGYGVSRPAARQALDLLRNRGYVVRWKGRGTFVSRPKVEKNIAEVVGFTAELEALGIAAGARVVSAGRRAAGADAAIRLTIFRGTPVFCLRRVRLADGLPVAIEESSIELARFPGIEKIDFAEDSLYRVLREQYGVRFTRVDEVLEAHAASRAEARLLEVSPRTSLLYVERTVWGSDGRPVETSQSSFRGDRYRAVLSVPSIKAE
jgi:GntR family transcriptional regulator